MRKLTTKQERFCEEYVIDFDATAAYKRAGYNVTGKAAGQPAASRLLANARVQAKIKAAIELLSAATGLTAKEAWKESSYIARSDIGDVIDFSGAEPRLRPANEIPESARRAIKSVKVKRCMEGTGEDAREVELLEFAFWDKPGELHTRLKALGELKERLEITGANGGDIRIRFIKFARTARAVEPAPGGVPAVV